MRAADLPERREADAELLVLGQVKVLEELSLVVGIAHRRPNRHTLPAPAQEGARARPRRWATSMSSRDVSLSS